MTREANWIITHDFTDEENMPFYNPQSERVSGLRGAPMERVEVWGPRGATKPNLDSLPLDFIVADDDGNVYYQGRANADAEFEPLDMYGMPNAGATTIAYKNGAKWEML